MERQSLYRGLGALYTDDILAGPVHQTATSMRLETRQIHSLWNNSAKIYGIHSYRKSILYAVCFSKYAMLSRFFQLIVLYRLVACKPDLGESHD